MTNVPFEEALSHLEAAGPKMLASLRPGRGGTEAEWQSLKAWIGSCCPVVPSDPKLMWHHADLVADVTRAQCESVAALCESPGHAYGHAIGLRPVTQSMLLSFGHRQVLWTTDAFLLDVDGVATRIAPSRPPFEETPNGVDRGENDDRWSTMRDVILALFEVGVWLPEEGADHEWWIRACGEEIRPFLL